MEHIEDVHRWDAEDLLGNNGNAEDIFLWDFETMGPVLVSMSSTDAKGPCIGGESSYCEDAWAPSMTRDGRLVAFTSWAPNLVPDVSGFNLYLAGPFRSGE